MTQPARIGDRATRLEENVSYADVVNWKTCRLVAVCTLLFCAALMRTR